MNYLFDSWDRVMRILCRRPVSFFFDYDGTLAPLADVPSGAVLPPRTKSLLRSMVVAGHDIAVVSGRNIGQVRRLVGIRGITYVGSHGLDVEGPGISFHKLLPPSYRKVLDEVRRRVRAGTRGISGVIIEDKGNTLSVHFRKVRPDLQSAVQTAFHEATAYERVREKIRVTAGKKVLEVRPSCVWDKGTIVLWLLARYRFLGKEDAIPVYIGDDRTDEDAFRALAGKGLTVFVGKTGVSSAGYYLKSPFEVYRFLRRAAHCTGGMFRD